MGVYWLDVSAVSIFGTMSADFLNKDAGMPLRASTVMLLVLQTTVFVLWYATKRTLDVRSINTRRRREIFYWLTVLITFALGTAAGDFAAETLGLGTLASTFVFLEIILVPTLGYQRFRLNEVLTFWFAYTITRPLGASFADWLGVPARYGDELQLGTGRDGSASSPESSWSPSCRWSLASTAESPSTSMRTSFRTSAVDEDLAADDGKQGFSVTLSRVGPVGLEPTTRGLKVSPSRCRTVTSSDGRGLAVLQSRRSGASWCRS
ncbi:MAG: hypothetical protein ACR2LE_08930 [Nocardioidaceae bacterium]